MIDSCSFKKYVHSYIDDKKSQKISKKQKVR